MPEAQEFSQKPIPSRDFKIENLDGVVNVHQKGRVSKITDPESGHNAYFLDVTDSVDPSRNNFGDAKGDPISQIYQDELDDTNYNDMYGMANGLSVLITDKLDESGRKRVYTGFPITDLTNVEKPKELTQPILLKAGFKHQGLYLPFSAQLNTNDPDSLDQTREIIAKEIISATHETPTKEEDVFQQANRVLTTI